MKTKYFLILSIALVGLSGCQANSQEKSQTNQNKQANQNTAAATAPTPKSEPLRLRLNREDAGTTANASALSDKLKKIFKDREDTGVFREGANEVEKTIVLTADPSAPAEEIAKAFGIMKDAGANPIVMEVPVKTAQPKLPRPNPLSLFVYVGSGEPKSSMKIVESIQMTPTTPNANASNTNVSGGKDDEEFNDTQKIEIDFVGESSGSNLIAVSKDGSFTMNGKQISKDELKTAIANNLKSGGEKAVTVKAESFGNMEDAAKIAAAAGSEKITFVTSNTK